MKKYIAIECGNSTYTELKMKNGEYEKTCDCIFVGRIKANNKGEAEEKIINSKEYKNRVFHKLILIEIV